MHTCSKDQNYTLIERRHNVKILSNDVNVMACSGYTLHTLKKES